MKNQKNKKILYNHKSKKGTKITVLTVIELAYKGVDYATIFICVA